MALTLLIFLHLSSADTWDFLKLLLYLLGICLIFTAIALQCADHSKPYYENTAVLLYLLIFFNLHFFSFIHSYKCKNKKRKKQNKIVYSYVETVDQDEDDLFEGKSYIEAPHESTQHGYMEWSKNGIVAVTTERLAEIQRNSTKNVTVKNIDVIEGDDEFIYSLSNNMQRSLEEELSFLESGGLYKEHGK